VKQQQEIRVVIADDEPAARAKLRRLLTPHTDLTVVAEAASGVAVIDAVRLHKPDLLLLDIRMPEINGLAALRTFDENTRPVVIFTTAYDDYAVPAFAEGVLDYVLKPFDAPRLDAALARAREHLELERRPSLEAVQTLIDRMRRDARDESAERADSGGNDYVKRIAIKTAGRVEMVRVNDIEWIEAQGNYVCLHTHDGRPLLRQSMRSLIEQLDPDRFVRIHRGAVVNLSAVVRLKRRMSGDYTVELRSGMKLRMSRLFRAEVESRL
jgi:two-component system LytT family response regulator